MIKECKKHGVTEHYFHTTSYRCKKCRSDSVSKRKRELKEILVQEFGGKCMKCGYNKSVKALQFHHIDPTEKSFSISNGTKSLERLRKEASKCQLLCANCHAEIR